MSSDHRDRILGLDLAISRRDFVNGAAAASVAGCAPPRHRWDGYGGVGDYSRSNGNTFAVVEAAHQVRDGVYADDAGGRDTGESFDVVVVGAGLAGLAAARTCQNAGVARCLILENHAMFGGEAKENEFRVDGHRLYGPQGSNDVSVPAPAGSEPHLIWRDLGLPETFEFAAPANVASQMRFGRENFVPMYWNLDAASTGHFFPDGSMVRDLWLGNLSAAPWSAAVKSDMRRWRFERPRTGPIEGREAWLDSLSYGDLLTRILGLRSEVLDYVDPIIAVSAFGVSADAISAYAAHLLRLPGAFEFAGRDPLPRAHETYISFPGGNSAIARYFVKGLICDAIAGGDDFASILNERVNFQALDRPGADVRLRLQATVIAVEHGARQGVEGVWVSYVRRGRKHRVFAHAVVMATGAWMTRRVVRGLPASQAAALEQFDFAPVLVVNVALRNWRFLDRLGISAARWFEGFGFFASIRRPMQVGAHSAPFDPNLPTVLTLYVGFPRRGLTAKAQGAAARQELFATDFSAFERRLRAQLNDLFARGGFDARRDIAAIVLNRWGHAFVAPQPGFFFDAPGAAAPSRLGREPFGRISFGHSQFRGHQNWVGAVAEGNRAAQEALRLL